MKRISTLIRFVAMAVAAVTLIFTPARSHDGMEDVTGTIQTVTSDSVSVKTTKGKTVAVKLDAKTEYTRGKAQAKSTDLKVGDRVVVHAKEMDKALTAHLVQLSTAKATK